MDDSKSHHSEAASSPNTSQLQHQLICRMTQLLFCAYIGGLRASAANFISQLRRTCGYSPEKLEEEFRNAEQRLIRDGLNPKQFESNYWIDRTHDQFKNALRTIAQQGQIESLPSELLLLAYEMINFYQN